MCRRALSDTVIGGEMSDSCTLLGNRLSQWEKNLDEEEMNPLVSQFYFSCGFPIIKEELFLTGFIFI